MKASDKDKIIAAVVILESATTIQIAALLGWPDRKRVSRRMKEILESGALTRFPAERGGFVYAITSESVVHGRNRKTSISPRSQLSLFR